MNRSNIAVATALALTMGGLFAAELARADHRPVTRGEFHEFAVGASSGMDIGGDARMIRTGGGRTLVRIKVTGLDPGIEYASHVHAAPCGVGEADGHYMHVPGGGTTPPNEIWPGPITADRHGVARGDTVADFVAGEAAVSVVVHRPGPTPNKIACADLE